MSPRHDKLKLIGPQILLCSGSGQFHRINFSLARPLDNLKLIGLSNTAGFGTVKSRRWIEVNIAVFSGSINKFLARLAGDKVA